MLTAQCRQHSLCPCAGCDAKVVKVADDETILLRFSDRRELWFVGASVEVPVAPPPKKPKAKQVRRVRLPWRSAAIFKLPRCR